LIKEIKAFIFDLDGVITDTAKYHFRSWERLANKEGIPFSKKVNEKMRGLTREQSLEILLNGRKISDEKRKEMMRLKNDYYLKLIKDIDGNDLFPGVKTLLSTLKNRNYTLAIASASRNAKPVINNLYIDDMFSIISDGNSVEQSKPAPDVFLHTAKKLGISPEACIVIEDSRAGVEGARKAGMEVIGIGPNKRVGKADYIYQKISDIELDTILQ
jgi:beta-phosphoglucomutase